MLQRERELQREKRERERERVQSWNVYSLYLIFQVLSGDWGWHNSKHQRRPRSHWPGLSPVHQNHEEHKHCRRKNIALSPFLVSLMNVIDCTVSNMSLIIKGKWSSKRGGPLSRMYFEEAWRERSEKKWSSKRGDPWSGLYLQGNLKRKVRKKGLQRGLVLSQGFIFRETWRKSFRKSGLQKGVIFFSGVYFQGNMKGKVSEKVVFREGWSLVRVVFH